MDYNFQETVKQYEAISAADLLETIRMEFPELKAEAYSSLCMIIKNHINEKYTSFNVIVEIMMEPSLYFAQELDEAVQVF